MQYAENGRVIRGVGGLYEIRLDAGASPLSGQSVNARARGVLRREGTAPLPGDRVQVAYGSIAAYENGADTKKSDDGGDAVIEKILPRRNALIRPPVANLRYLFTVFSAAKPTPVLTTVDKLISVAEYADIEPVIVITKEDLDPAGAAQYEEIYRRAGFPVFTVSVERDRGVAALREFACRHLKEEVAAFAGASGVGKSTLLNALCPEFALSTGGLSRKTERGRHTTRKVELYAAFGGYLADTPGFSLLDFTRFDFFSLSDLAGTMREFRPLLGGCRYTGCTHTKEEGCAVLQAVREGRIAESRHRSFLSMYGELKDKHEWSRKS